MRGVPAKNNEQGNYRRGARPSQSDKKNHRKKAAKLLGLIVAVSSLLCFGLAYLGCTEIQQSRYHAENMKNIVDKLCFASGGVFFCGLAKFVYDVYNKQKKIHMFWVGTLIVLFVFLGDSAFLFVYAGHSIANYEMKEEIAIAKNNDEGDSQKQLEEFFWPEDVLIENAKKYQGGESGDSDIPRLLQRYLNTEIKNKTTNDVVFEKNVEEANAVKEDCTKCKTFTMQLHGLDDQLQYRLIAAENKLDIDNCKLIGDLYVERGDLRVSSRLEDYKMALVYYINALHIFYYYDGKYGTQIGESMIWEALSQAYSKLATTYVTGKEAVRAEVMANICGSCY